MPRKLRVVLFVMFACSTALFLAGCGGGAQTVQPTPQGFSNSSLSGTYAFAVSGSSANGFLGLAASSFYAVAGSFQANGSGTITSGTMDVNSTAGVFTNLSITGTYSVRADGRTTASLTTPQGNFSLDFVLLNSSSGLAIQFQNTATGSGSIDLQTSSAFSLSSLAGALAFNVSGVDAGGNPEGTAGLLNIDSSGNITGGVADDNDGGGTTLNIAVPAASAAVSAPSGSTGRGTLTIGGTTQFAYYVINANHVKLVTINSGVSIPFLAGDAFRQTTSSVSGSFAFTLAGATSSGTGVFTAGGILSTDGAGNVTNSSVTDVNNGGTFSQDATTTGTYAVSGGRGTMTLSGGFGVLNLVFYPSTGGLLILEVDTTVLSSGTGLQQSGAPFSNATLNGAFGLTLVGFDLGNGVGANGIAQFTSTGTGTLTGAFDFNDGGNLSNSLSLSGTYSIGSNGRGTGTLKPSSLSNVDVVYYVVSGSQVLFMQVDANQVSVGLIGVQ